MPDSLPASAFPKTYLAFAPPRVRPATPEPQGDGWLAFSLAVFPNDEPCPLVWQIKVASLLHRKGYGIVRTRRVIEYCREFGSAQCCPFLRGEADRDECEKLLPESSAGWWLDYSAWIWNAN